MTKKRKIGISLAVLCAGLIMTMCLLLPRGVKITADLSALEPRDGQYGPAGEITHGTDNLYYNSPNWQWWVEQWTGRDGMIAPVSASDDRGFSYVAVDGAAKRIDIVCQSYQGDVKLNLKGFQATAMGTLSKVKVTVESVRNSGEQGAVYHATLRQVYVAGTEKDTFSLELEDTAPEDTYHIVISPTGTETIEPYLNERLPLRYEAEEGKLTGDASIVKNKLNQNAYVRGIEGDSALTFRLKAPETGSYRLDLIYSAAGQNEAGSFLYASQLLLVDGEQVAKLNYPSTGSENVFSSNSITLELEKGFHELTLRQSSGGAAAIDCVDFRLLSGMREEEPSVTYQGIADAEHTTAGNMAFLLPVPTDGYYDLTFFTAVSQEETVVCKIQGDETSVLQLNNMGEVSTCVYLQKGLNLIELPHHKNNLITALEAVFAQVPEEEKVSLSIGEPAFIGGAQGQIADNPAKTDCAVGLATPADSVSYTVSAPSSGTYKLTFLYAVQDAEEKLNLGLRVNGQEREVSCENTLGEAIFRQRTLTVTLEEGENTLTFYGTGENDAAFCVAEAQVFFKCLDKAEE